jgi:lycopene beta-cyclase
VLLLITLPLEFVLGARVLPTDGQLGLCDHSSSDHLSVWDLAGILRDHWSYSARFTTGWKLIFGMPIEELVFFMWCPSVGR